MSNLNTWQEKDYKTWKNVNYLQKLDGAEIPADTSASPHSKPPTLPGTAKTYFPDRILKIFWY